MNCCICGKEMTSKTAYPFHEDTQKRICAECSERKLDLAKANHDPLKYVNSYDFLMSYAISDLVSEDVKDYLKTYLAQHELTVEKFRQKAKSISEYNTNKSFFESDGLIISTTDDAFGSEIQEYIGIVSGETILGTGFASGFMASLADVTGTRSGAYEEKLAFARNSALIELKQRAISHGADAVIGLRFHYVLNVVDLISVMVDGTAVKLKNTKNND